MAASSTAAGSGGAPEMSGGCASTEKHATKTGPQCPRERVPKLLLSLRKLPETRRGTGMTGGAPATKKVTTALSFTVEGIAQAKRREKGG